MKHFGILFVALMALCIGGCGLGVEDSTELERPKIEFRGKPDPVVFGKWKRDGSDAYYTFVDDGTYSMKGTVNTPGGQFPVNEDGEWAVEDGKIIFRRKDGVVLEYHLQVEGDTLTMTSTGTLKHETKLTKAK